MRFNVAATLPINESSAPVLTRAQVWEALKLKSRDPVRFLPVITDCKVLEENAGGLTRVVNFKPGTGPPGDVTEIITFHEPVKADFVMPDLGTAISNIVSSGKGGEHDLYLTFTFSWNFPEIEEGTDEAAEKAKMLDGMAWDGVSHTIAQIRELVKSGEIV